MSQNHQNHNLTKVKYRPEIDGLRAFAVISVIINHFNKDILPSGYLGVDIFFVISGFVITSSLYGRHNKKFSDYLSSFYSRRIKRLFPALLVFILIISFITYLFDPTVKQNLRMGVTSLLGISNIYVFQQQSDYFGPAQELNPLLHTWSLAVEEQFYLIFPFLTWFSGFNRNTRNGSRNLFFIMSATALASLICFFYFYNLNLPAAYFLPTSRVWEIAFGCICFITLKKRTDVEILLQKIPPSLFISIVIFCMFLPVKYGLFATATVVLCTTFLLVSLKEKTLLYKFLTNKKVVRIGLLSYSLYLWHWGVLSISRLTVGVHWWTIPLQITLIIIFALLSYKYIETPFRASSLKNKSKIFMIWGLGMSSSLALLFGFNKISYRLFLGNKVSIKDDISQIEGWDKKNCAEGFAGGFISQYKNKSIDFDNCWIDFVDESGITRKVKEQINIYSYGNSYNIQLIPVLKKLTREHKNKYEYKLNVVSCVGITSARIVRFAQKNNPCITTFQNYIKWSLNNSNKKSILLINSSMIFFSGKDVLFDLSRGRIIQPNYAKQIFAEELNRIGEKAKSKNVDFYITSGVPFLLANPVTCGNWFNQLNSNPCNTLDPNSKKFQLTPYEDILGLTNKDVSGINIYRELEEALSSKKYLDIYFSSKDHISAEGSFLLLPLFQETFNK